MSGPSCTHLDEVKVADVPARAEVPGSSPNKHASRHAHDASHPIMSSIEPGEDWSWCVLDEVAFVLA
jgi:hypothetical protein